jgi:hypothetical protein
LFVIPPHYGQGDGGKPATNDGASVGKAKKEMRAGQAEINAETEASQEKTNAKIVAGHEEMKAHQDKVDVEAKAHHDQLKEDIKGHMGVLLEGLRSCENGTTCQVLSVVCPENSKAGLKEMEANMITLKESSDKMDATDLEANPEATEAVLEQKELHKEQLNMDTIGS